MNRLNLSKETIEKLIGHSIESSTKILTTKTSKITKKKKVPIPATATVSKIVEQQPAPRWVCEIPLVNIPTENLVTSPIVEISNIKRRSTRLTKPLLVSDNVTQQLNDLMVQPERRKSHSQSDNLEVQLNQLFNGPTEEQQQRNNNNNTVDEIEIISNDDKPIQISSDDENVDGTDSVDFDPVQRNTLKRKRRSKRSSIILRLGLAEVRRTVEKRLELFKQVNFSRL